MKDINKVKLIILDNDGVFTDGKITYDNNGVESKNFTACDGLGIKMLTFTDIKVAIITGRESAILTRRCNDLKIEFLFQKVRNKLKIADQLRQELGLNWENIAVMGDDWNDYPLLSQAALSAVPHNAFDDLKSKVDFVASRKGGEGAVREFIELILKEQGKYDEVVEKLLAFLETH
jgi:3-deoxy-D-manno-octulosonate 8-phosphate phosphatase (KDO 8-P phosphatase)